MPNFTHQNHILLNPLFKYRISKMNIIALLPLFFGNIRGWQAIIILLVILLLFGAKRLPTLMRSMGQSVHAFRQGLADAQAEINKEVKPSDKSESKKDED